MINWKVRAKNKTFWLALIPAVLLFIQSVAALFGYSLDITETNHKMVAVIETLFTVLSILGIVVDPTTAGINDSERAMGYERPHED